VARHRAHEPRYARRQQHLRRVSRHAPRHEPRGVFRSGSGTCAARRIFNDALGPAIEYAQVETFVTSAGHLSCIKLGHLSYLHFVNLCDCVETGVANNRGVLMSKVTLLAFAALFAGLGLSGCGGGGVDETTNIPGSTAPGTTAALAWDAVTDPNLSGYRIYYGTAPGTYLQSVGQGLIVGDVTTYTVTGLSSGTRYYFAATAYDTSNSESIFSNEVFKDIP